ncbi:MAG TPA: lycopene cyclase domain-containing protein [Cyclobacteriaceae bacterium]|nr:lycopene cyclase domain-containing protein [Cyclobacteriaceae bacterium]
MLESKYLYLLINFFSILLPFAFSFHPKANFSKKWKYLAPAIAIPGAIFIIWDVYFTQMGVWGFNPKYLSGIYLINLPIEEWLFFITIPYACVFTYEAVNYYSKRDILGPYQKYISYALIFFLLTLGILNLDKWYTSVTFISTAVFICLQVFWWKPDFLGRFYFAFLFILIPFFIVNGLLTGSMLEEQVVWYNDAENLGIRMFTIPFEDTFYGMLLLMMNVSLFEYLQRKY